jgi:hypothetical protein
MFSLSSTPRYFDQLLGFFDQHLLFGHFPALLQVDVISYENITSDSPVWPALMGINAQLASISRSTALVLGTLKKGASGQQQQQPVRMAREILPTPGTSLGGAPATAQPLQVSGTPRKPYCPLGVIAVVVWPSHISNVFQKVLSMQAVNTHMPCIESYFVAALVLPGY